MKESKTDTAEAYPTWTQCLYKSTAEAYPTWTHCLNETNTKAFKAARLQGRVPHLCTLNLQGGNSRDLTYLRRAAPYWLQNWKRWTAFNRTHALCSFTTPRMNFSVPRIRINHIRFLFILLPWFSIHSSLPNQSILHPIRSLTTKLMDLSSLAQGETCLTETQRRSKGVSKRHYDETTCSLTTQTLNLSDVAQK